MRLIDADALEEKLDKIPARRIENADGRAYVLIRLSTVLEIIKQMPSAQPERESDEWIEASVAGMPALYHEKCNTFVYAPNGKKGFNFCPNCGADMRGEQYE